MQNITIAGRLGRDAETRPAGNETVTGFTVAVDDRAGHEKKVTNWYRVSIWGKRGQALEQYLTKGSVVSVSGPLSVSEYEGKTQLNVRADQITLLGGGQQDDRARSASNDRQQARERSNVSLDDDIPF